MITNSDKQTRINGRKICLFDTPESRLLYLDRRELELIAAIGGNGITCTLRGGDVTSITPYMNNNPNDGFDFNKLAKWHDYFAYANSLGIVPFGMLSEKENHFNLTDAQNHELIEMMVSYFQDLSIIWQREELPIGHDAWITRWFTELKNKISSLGCNHLVAIHNDTDVDVYKGHLSHIDLVALQTKLATGNASIKEAYDLGFSVFQSELVGGVTSGNAKQWCNLGQGMSSGAGAFFPADDLKAPQYVNNDLKYKDVYKILVTELSGTTTNPPTMRKLFITKSNVVDASAVELTEGASVAANRYAFYVDGGAPVTLEMLKDGASFHASRVENGAPLAFGGDDGGKLRLKDCPAGNYIAKISGQMDIHFTVGTVTPPQPTSEPVTETYIESGSVVVFKTAIGTYKTSVTKV